MADVGAIRPDLIVSYSYRHMIEPEVLGSLPGKFINLHISLLPYNRGADPNLWSFLEDTPRGVSIHEIDAGIDTGPILIQKEITFDEGRETLTHSYEVLHQEIQALFREHWDGLRDGTIEPIPQVGQGTFHSARQFTEIRGRLLGAEGWDITIPVLKERYQSLLADDTILEGGDE